MSPGNAAQLSPDTHLCAPAPLTQVNGLDQAAFVRLVGPVFEHSPWIAEAAWARRPFSDVADLHAALCQVVLGASAEQKLSLIRAHPDLAGRAALAGSLTPESAAEQAGAGLDRLTPEELELFRQRNSDYRAKFGFPFVICARLNDKQAILDGLALRLENTGEGEMARAMDEIFKIAELRLVHLIRE